MSEINGIDVSECEYINCCSKKAKCIILQDDISSDSQYCESEPNCYFKQLKRLEQENKELKEKQIINDIDKLDGMVKIKGKCGYEFIGGCRELKKYKQALDEIRSYCDEQNLKADYTACYITNKIDEVLDDRN